MFKYLHSKVYHDLLNDQPNREESNVIARDVQAKVTNKDSTPMEAEIPYTCNFCNKATFSDPEECFKHAASCVFNPREDPFVKAGILRLPTKAANKQQ